MNFGSGHVQKNKRSDEKTITFKTWGVGITWAWCGRIEAGVHIGLAD